MHNKHKKCTRDVKSMTASHFFCPPSRILLQKERIPPHDTFHQSMLVSMAEYDDVCVPQSVIDCRTQGPRCAPGRKKWVVSQCYGAMPSCRNHRHRGLRMHLSFYGAKSFFWLFPIVAAPPS